MKNKKRVSIIGIISGFIILIISIILLRSSDSLDTQEEEWDESNFKAIDEKSTKLVLRDIGPGKLIVHASGPQAKGGQYPSDWSDMTSMMRVDIGISRILDDTGNKVDVKRDFFDFKLDKRADYEVLITKYGDDPVFIDVEYIPDINEISIYTTCCLAPTLFILSLSLIITSSVYYLKSRR